MVEEAVSMSDMERAEECAKRMFAEYPDILRLIKHENMYHMVEYFITRAWMEGHNETRIDDISDDAIEQAYEERFFQEKRVTNK